ncbi:MAG: hypothetical protein JWO57_4041 [Pseudonocardiales bacterium]|nr:hypothetical protein [Pseudonocardiales bacterium]
MSQRLGSRRPAHAPRVPFALLVVGLIVGGLCALLALNTASAANELSRHDLATRDAAIAAQVQQLRNEVAASAAPGSLGSAAAALGMVAAGNPAFLKIGTDGKVRVLGSAAPASAPPVPAAPTPTRKPTPSKAPKSAEASKSAKATGHAGTATTKRHPSTPTPTPTPTVTIPGGQR